MKLNDLHRLMGDGVTQQVLAGNIGGLVASAADVGTYSRFAMDYGGALINKALDQGGAGVQQVLDTIGAGQGFNISGVIGLVFAAIGRIVKSISSAGEETQRNWSIARTTYLSACFGVRQVPEMPMVLCGGDGKDKAGGGAGCYRFVRPGAAEDRCVPYYDALSWVSPLKPGEAADWSPLPAFLSPYRLPMGRESAKGENDNGQVGYSFSDVCTDAALLLLDAGSQDCGDYRFSPAGWPRLSICWAWAWPLTCPSRICNKVGRSSDFTVERSVAGLFLLPTAQHLQTRMSDVRESERLLRNAMAVYYPDAAELAPGIWRIIPNGKLPLGFGASRASFEALADALHRVQMFKRTRAIISANMSSLPDELWPYVGSDFKGGLTVGDAPQPAWKQGAKPEVKYAGDEDA